MSTAEAAGKIWGERARDWADVQEPQFKSLFQAVIEATAVNAHTRLLDITCATGYFCDMAAQRGALVSGIDAAGALLDIARERVPQGDFRTGDMEQLPWAEGTFTLVTGFNAFQFASSPVNAVREAARVARRGAPVVLGGFGKPADCQAMAYIDALVSLLPPPRPTVPLPFALSFDGAFENLAEQAGMTYGDFVELDCPWIYPDEATALRGLLSSGPAVRAMQLAGEAATRDAVLNAIAPYKTASGGYRMENKARYLVARTTT